ncbi:MAG: transporter substrate-binding domain-containing protein [Bacteroidetes bacterium]|nr:transporter substrate-binding domain-containing protein [Bacteroidota bacterium]
MDLRFRFVLLFCLAANYGQTQTWQEVKNARQGTITIYWYDSKPFIFSNKGAQMEGIEFELLNGFAAYLQEKHGVRLTLNWVRTNGFQDTYMKIWQEKKEGTFGASDFSITLDRKTQVSYSPAYMRDYNSLITSRDIAVAKSVDELRKLLTGATAITIKATTYETDLLNLRETQQIPFAIEYIHSSKNIQEEISKRNHTFGFIELPVYLMKFKENPTLNVNRQNLLPTKREGYGIIYPKDGTWKEPIDEYFGSDYYQKRLDAILSKYIDRSVLALVDTLSTEASSQASILSQEKDIQNKDLLEKQLRLETESTVRKWLLGFAGVSLVLLGTIAVLYRNTIRQKEQIKQQGNFIEANNLQLQKRNASLLALNEEKNNLIRILAHDLRTPVNQVQGLVQLLQLDKSNLNEMQQEVVQKISDSSNRLGKMITHILDIDSLENNRVNVFLEKVSVNTLLHQLTKNFEQAASQKQITLRCELSPDRPNVNADPLFLTQVMENLISNAIKFSPPNKKVVVSSAFTENKVRLSVQDQGPGLTEQDHQLVFKKFTKLSAKPTAGEPSTGLGLSIVKKYSELMGGNVEVESVPGVKTIFSVVFDSV